MVGDVVLLESGDKIPADGVVIDGFLYVNESSINGESKEVHKEKYSYGNIKDKNKLYRGCIVCEGAALSVITNVGDNTFYGKIARSFKKKRAKVLLK